MPASSGIITLTQSLENLNGKHGISGSYEDMTAGVNVAVPSLSPSPGYVTEKKSTRSVAWFASLPDRQRHSQFLKEAVDLMLDKAVFDAASRTNRVVEWRSPEELKKLIDLDLPADRVSHDRLLQLLKDIIQYSVKTGHPYFVNQLFSSVDPYGLVGQWLGDALNPSVYTYEVSPVFTLMEETVLCEMRRIVGFPEGRGDGIFCPGGSIANGYAISCARYNFVPDVKKRGLHGLPRLVLFTSEDAHYSIKKMASLLGLGSDNVYLIHCNSKGKMDVQHLEQEIQRALEEGAAPFMVSATAGTTVLGAFDPIPKIADICSKYKMWLHVDAAWGGGALVSKKHKHLLEGIEKADSVTWNPHKLLTAPQQCSTFLLRHEGVLSACHSASAQYLFQKDKFYDTQYDTGDKHIQCGRRADVLKFWFMWKAKGTVGLEEHIDTVFDNAAYFTKQIKKREGFRMVLQEPECTNVCFWYIPPSLRGHEDQSDFSERLHKVAPRIKERMIKEGSMMVTYQPLRDQPNFFRLVLQNSGLDWADMDYFVQEFERLGSDL
ncbi:Cysteine sulfinic acid decarboxylase [Cryptotermes secundus]|uniref:Cysteine sulfinic acid decarboxylase n=1 Tax=Cryptotermes secundus TaxID=105785 RepID=A0A2J7PB96_9NEOP|nr:cysteine sulfinic acid decarboxylase [Cryptotermes secundus]PNF13607.1 Cysteine sulfinic acid decarboxylase [Cryptotermes secundus]